MADSSPRQPSLPFVLEDLAQQPPLPFGLKELARRVAVNDPYNPSALNNILAPSKESKIDHARPQWRAMAKSPELLTEKDLVAFDHVAAGHEGISSNTDGSLVIKPCTQAEIGFYQAAQTGHEGLKAHMPAFMGVLALSLDQTAPPNGVGPALQVHQAVPSALMPHVPHGWLPSNAEPAFLPTPISSKRTSWKPSGGKKLDTPTAIVLENVAAGFSHPNIIDIKLGSRLWADDAPDAKRRKLDDVARETTSGSLGFRIAGMKIWIGRVSDGEEIANKEKGIEYKDGYLCYNKIYGRSFDEETVKQGFIEYFGGIALSSMLQITQYKRRNIGRPIRRILRELESIRYVLRHEESRMYSASVLIVTEGDDRAMDSAIEGDKIRIKREQVIEKVENGTATKMEMDLLPDSDDEEDELPKLYDIRLIDFAHAQFTKGQGPDTNVLNGLNVLIRIFRELDQLGKSWQLGDFSERARAWERTHGRAYSGSMDGSSD